MDFFTHLKDVTLRIHIYLSRSDTVVIIIMIFFACFPAGFAAVLVCGVQCLHAAAWALHIILSIWSTLNSQSQEKVVLFPSYSLF